MIVQTTTFCQAGDVGELRKVRNMPVNDFGPRFGALVKQRRGQEGYTQQQLAVLAFGDERAKSRISELENGHVINPQQRLIDALIVALDLSEDDLAACRKPAVPALPAGFAETVGLTEEVIEAISWSFSSRYPQATPQQYQEFLRNKAEEIAQLQARIGALGEVNERVSNIVAAASDAIEHGRFDEADRLLEDAEEIQFQHHTLSEVRKQLRIRSARGEAALLKGAPKEAYEHFHAAALYIEPFDAIESSKHRQAMYINFFTHSIRAGGTGMEYVIKLIEKNLDVYNGSEFPQERAKTLNNLALAQARLASQLIGRERYDAYAKCIETYQTIEKTINRFENPITWSQLKNNLGIAYQNQCIRLSLDEELAGYRKAIKEYEAALEILHKEKDKIEVARTSLNLGSALFAIGEKTEGRSGESSLEKAASSLTVSSRIFEANGKTNELSSASYNLGNVYNALGRRKSGNAAKALLERSVDSFRVSLDYRPRSTHPEPWATAKKNIGLTLEALSEVCKAEDRQAYLLLALDELEEAHEVIEGGGSLFLLEIVERRMANIVDKLESRE